MHNYILQLCKMFDTESCPVKRFFKLMALKNYFRIKKLLWTPKQGYAKKLELAARLILHMEHHIQGQQ